MGCECGHTREIWKTLMMGYWPYSHGPPPKWIPPHLETMRQRRIKERDREQREWGERKGNEKKKEERMKK